MSITDSNNYMSIMDTEWWMPPEPSKPLHSCRYLKIIDDLFGLTYRRLITFKS